MLRPLSVAVVIPCHNYGRFLAEAIDSVLAQTVSAAEILVIVDRSVDDSFEVAERYRQLAIRVIRVDYGNVHDVRRLGFEQTTSNVLCFLDADDRLGRDYLEQGLAGFASDDVGIVYSDLDLFGSMTGRRTFPDTFSRAALHQENYIHAGSLVRRDVLEVTAAFSAHLEARTASCTGDWWLWKCVTAGGWTARKQTGRYYYRRHAESALATKVRDRSRFEVAWLAYETLTLFVALSGRALLWPQMAKFLEQQTWPHNQIRLILLDTSQNDDFSRTVRHWIADSDYTDIRHIKRTVGIPNLADQPRLESATDVRISMARIYNLMRRELSTELVWILEDDILPPRDVARKLLEDLDERTVSVAAPYRSRFNSGYVAWGGDLECYTTPQQGVTSVGGNGFGCAIIRTEMIRRMTFSHGYLLPDFDRAFYASLHAEGFVKKVNWDVECLHFCSSNAVMSPAQGPRPAKLRQGT
ncbi:MAG: glycosyltransferase family 2 protein [Planctomycetaceae bacterium]